MGRLLDVRVFKEATNISDHYLVAATVRVTGKCGSRRMTSVSKMELKVYKR